MKNNNYGITFNSPDGETFYPLNTTKEFHFKHDINLGNYTVHYDMTNEIKGSSIITKPVTTVSPKPANIPEELPEEPPKITRKRAKVSPKDIKIELFRQWADEFIDTREHGTTQDGFFICKQFSDIYETSEKTMYNYFMIYRKVVKGQPLTEADYKTIRRFIPKDLTANVIIKEKNHE